MGGNSTMIKNIEISKIHSHPNNPRKDLGELTELSESIKATGILQNLTVVPWFSKLTGKGCDDPKQQEEMGYTVIIGHRRLAAAKLAGLTEVPCVITEMDKKTQVATMLLENMQRSDLTVYEQAQGIQMMMDLGESVKDISDKTGFSETTIRRRTKLLDLDQDKFKESIARGASLMDYVELEKIKDPELKNEVLETIGTNNFQWKLNKTIEQEEKEKNYAIIESFLNNFATKVDKIIYSTMEYVHSFNSRDAKKLSEDDLQLEECEYYYIKQSWGAFDLYKEKSEELVIETEEDIEKKRKHEERRAKNEALSKISEQAYNSRYNFVQNVSNTCAKVNLGVIVAFLINALTDRQFTLYKFLKFSAIEDMGGGASERIRNLTTAISKSPEKHILYATYMTMDSDYYSCHNWEGYHVKSESLDLVYEFLEILGYEKSDEEKQYTEGTHELFITEDED